VYSVSPAPLYLPHLFRIPRKRRSVRSRVPGSAVNHYESVPSSYLYRLQLAHGGVNVPPDHGLPLRIRAERLREPGSAEQSHSYRHRFFFFDLEPPSTAPRIDQLVGLRSGLRLFARNPAVVFDVRLPGVSRLAVILDAR
jgi:hypothetical protein